jgi:hypothetical protein
MTIPEYWERHKRGNRLTDADWENHVERVKHWKEVGIPDIGGMLGTGRPYIQFHTEPPIRFEFATEEEFQQAQGAIRRARWKTTDLS